MRVLNFTNWTLLLVIFLGMALEGTAQISPGDLAKVHSHLEGMSNCTQCHTLGAKVSNDKCLTCHKEIKSRLDQSRGYHSSAGVKSKDCTVCHSDHYGKNYDIVHLQKEKFDHNTTGYTLDGKHAKKDCIDCHNKKFVTETELLKKRETYLGLSGLCASCHEDVHYKTLSSNCQNCHQTDAFKPAIKFNHAKSNYPLRGKHTAVDCLKCHPISLREAKNFQQFKGLQFQNCVNCHKDPHDNKFGQNCSQCHVEESFKTLKSVGQFDHNKTGYWLIGRHGQVTCKLCHKTALTDPVKHEKCLDCHKDYHRNQFNNQNVVSDCSVCHDVYGFEKNQYSVEKHNLTRFKLEGAHLATPCFECHRKAGDWNFRMIGEVCLDCHKDPHDGLIDAKYYPGGKCEKCHVVMTWNEVKFDHEQTNFKLEGKHSEVSCRKCHFASGSVSGLSGQQFKSLKNNCNGCHKDVHQGQFQENGQNFCERCHTFTDWKPTKFNHNNTRFKLDGGHKDVSCNRCHKVLNVNGFQYINYQFKHILCATCHS